MWYTDGVILGHRFICTAIRRKGQLLKAGWSFIFHSLKQNKTQSACAESTCKGVNQHSKDVTQTKEQRPELPTVTLTWHASKLQENAPLVEFIHLVYLSEETNYCVWFFFNSMDNKQSYLLITYTPGVSYHRQLRSLWRLLSTYQHLVHWLSHFSSALPP